MKAKKTLSYKLPNQTGCHFTVRLWSVLDFMSLFLRRKMELFSLLQNRASYEHTLDIFRFLLILCGYANMVGMEIWQIIQIKMWECKIGSFLLGKASQKKYVYFRGLTLDAFFFSSKMLCFDFTACCTANWRAHLRQNSNSGVLAVYWAYIWLRFIKWNAKALREAPPKLAW